MRTALLCVMFAGAAISAAEMTEAELKEKALKLNKEITSEETANAVLKDFNKDKENTPKLVKLAAKLQREAKEGDKPFRFYPALVLAKAAQNCKEYDAAETFYTFGFDDAIKAKSGKLQVLAGVSLIDFYMFRKQYDKCIDACDKFLKLEDDEAQRLALGVMERKLRAMVRNGESDKAMEVLNTLLKGRRTSEILKFQLLDIKARLLRENGKFADAIAVYKDCLEKVEASEDLNDNGKKIFESAFRYAMSGVYTEMDKIDEAVKELEKLIELNPENPTYKNDLGFVWCDHDQNLEKAEKLIREAIKQDLAQRKKLMEAGELDADKAKKANSAYTDSLGWVLYKQKKYEEALKYCLESAGSDDDESDHIEIWDHVGDCYLALDKKKEALEAYQKGLKSEDTTKKDAERRRKVTEKINKLKKELKP